MSGSGKPLLLGMSLLTLALVAAASFLPESRVWGLNHLAYFPVALRLMLLALVALCFVPPVARTLVDGFLSLTAVLATAGRRGAVLGIVLGLLSIGVFWTLRTGTSLLGDGHLLMRTYTAAQEGDRTLIPSSTHNILSSERIAIGTSLLYLWIGRWAHEQWGMSWVDGWRLFNCVLGGVFVVLLLWMSRSPGWTPLGRLWLLVLVLFSAVLELFFGYIENYTPLLLFLLVFVASSVRALHWRGSPLWPPLVLAFCTLLHVQALALLPALVYLLAWRARPQVGAFVERRLAPILMALMVLGVALIRVTPLQHYLMRWMPREGAQAVLSPGHGLDVLNEIFLLLPAVLFFVALAVLLGREAHWSVTLRPEKPLTGATVRSGRRSRRSRNVNVTVGAGPAAAPTPWLQTRNEWNFFGLITWGCLLYLLLFEAEIGVARDWDLFAMLAVGLVPQAVVLWNRYERSLGGFGVAVDAVTVAPLLVLTVILGMSWVQLNHSVPHATRRFESILTWETAKVPYGLEALAATYSDNGRVPDAVRIMEKAVQISPNKRLHALLGTYLYSAGEYQRAQQILREELENAPDDVRLRTWLIRVLHDLHDEEGQEVILRQGVQTNPDNLRFHLLLGELLVRRGKADEGIQHLRIGRKADMPPTARAHIDALIRQYEERSSGK